jgi:UDP-glucose 4-epimerase
MITQEIHAVIHFAAKIVVPESVTNSLLYYTNNTYGVISTLKACKNAGVKNFVFSSTAAIYGENNLEVLSETTPVSPSNPYAFSKLFSEQIVRDAENDFGCKSIVFRYFNVAGASDNLKFGQITTSATHLIKIVSQAAVGKRDKVYITGTDYPTHDGTGIRDYIHVTDLAHAHVLGLNYLLSGGESDLFNIGYGNGSSVREVIACMKKVTNIDFPVIETDRRLGDVQRLVANPNKIVKILNWHPRFQNLEKICESAYLFEKKLTSANLDF